MTIITPRDISKETVSNLPEQTPTSSSDQLAFHQRPYPSPKEAWRGMNDKFWRWGLVFSQGNEWNVSVDRVKQRLRFIAGNLLRAMYGNNYRTKANIVFLVFKHGSSKSFDEHYHALMGFERGRPVWSDLRIDFEIKEIDTRFKGHKSEKCVWVDRDWKNGNHYHSYVSRFVQTTDGSSDDWFFLEKT
jgi:hypothetical protein